MDFLSLPVELIREILIQVIIARGLKRGLRLRLVCRFFSAEVTQAVYASRILDGYCVGNEPPFHLSYLQYRVVRLSKENAPPRLKLVIQTAELLCARTDYAKDDLHRIRKCIEALCELIPPACYYEHFSYETPGGNDFDFLDKHLLVAAAYLNQLELVAELAPDAFHHYHSGFAFRSSVFGSPINAAARKGHAHVLEILFQSMPQNTSNDTKRRMKYSAAYHAALHGQLEAFEMFLNDRWIGWENPHVSLPGRGASHPLYVVPFTPNKEIYLRWKAFERKQPFSLFKSRPIFDLNQVLRSHVRKGNTEMFEHLVKTSFIGSVMAHKLDRPERSGGKLVEQVCYWSTPIFRFLQRDVADWPRNLATVCYAANGGQFEIVKHLVENGQSIDNVPPGEGLKPGIVAAFVNEDVKMFEYLLQNGATFNTPNTLGMAIQIAKTEGLDSMLDLLSKRHVPLNGYACLPSWKTPRCKQCQSLDEHNDGIKIGSSDYENRNSAPS